ncbi:hypothetical protein G9A89_021759 [Geosiphon pyriformis]|nr:hypothetical protein G9A89_021759 [Geosiphon pyriformis]
MATLQPNSSTNDEGITLIPCKVLDCNCAHFARDRSDKLSCCECEHHIKKHLQPDQLITDETISEFAVQGATPQTPPKIETLTEPPEGEIWFYNRDNPFFFLTNFIEGYPIKAALPDNIFDGDMAQNPNTTRHPYYSQEKLWPTSEHLFQAMKFKDTNPDVSERIRRCRSARDALNMARRHQEFVDPKWQERNVDAMLWVVKQKFCQHPALGQGLLETGDHHLVEHTEMDKFWGDGGDGNGKNNLGKVLMKVRELLREKWDKKRQQSPPQRAPSPNNNGSVNQNFYPSGPPPPIPPKPHHHYQQHRHNNQPYIHFSQPASPHQIQNQQHQMMIDATNGEWHNYHG